MKKFSANFSSTHTAAFASSLSINTQHQLKNDVVDAVHSNELLAETTSYKGMPVTIATAFDNVNNEQYLGNNRGITDDTRPTFYGMAGANEIVTLYSGDTILGSVQADDLGQWFVEITEDLDAGVNEIVAKTATQQSQEFVVNVEQAIKPVTFNIHYPGSEGAVENGDIISAMPTISGTAAAYAAVDLSYTTEHGVFYSRIYADQEGNWQTTPDFLYVDGVFGTRFEIEASSGDFTTEKFVINVMPVSHDLMADILIDNNFALFDDVPAVVAPEPLVLSITEADMQFQSEGMANQIYDIQPAFPIYQDDLNYLVSVT